MEFRDHLKIINKSKVLIIVLVIIISLGSFLFSFYKDPIFDASISFTVNRINKQQTEFYEFDGYYAIQASDLFAATVISWFLTPSFLLEVYDEAGIDPEIVSLERFANRFRTKQFSSQNIVVRFKETTQDRAQKISQAIIEKVEEQSALLNQTEDNQALFEVVGSKPVVVEKKTNVVLVTFLGFLVGLILGISIVYILRYFKEESP